MHGIPREDKYIQDGDIVSVDVGSYYQGVSILMPARFLCGEVSQEVRDLVRVTKESFLGKAMEFAYPGKRLGDLSSAVQDHCEAHGYGIVQGAFGHGIGRNLHEDPTILNYGKAGTGPRLQVGMVLCVEPMVTLGSRHILLKDDEWTIVTRDGKAMSHYENTLR